MSERASQLRAMFDERRYAFEDFVAALSGEEWQRRCPAEGWPVGYVAHHVGQGFARPMSWIEEAIAGGGAFRFDWDVTHRLNASRTERIGVPEKDEVLRWLRDCGDRLSELIGGLSDEQLATEGFVQGTASRDVEWIIRVVLPRHMNEHEKGIRAALDVVKA